MNSIKLNIDHAASFTGREKIAALDNEAASALDKVLNGTGAGNDFLGWVTLPTDIDAAHLADIQATADTLRSSCDYVVAIGIGGSYLGAKAVLRCFSPDKTSERTILPNYRRSSLTRVSASS